MLVAALLLAFVAFVAFVYYIMSGSTVALIALFVATGVGLVLFVLDTFSKRRKRSGEEGLAEELGEQLVLPDPER
ncbi:hypothetical protein [Corynebacterium sp.]|uniref:hypothetical protein n=1 Tax=Corynebacterium sp. TaxID=1720 RepID=UPI0026DD1398|nr:hypothetical protein [Corynebacterium sp.]MDO5031401.1 hypothetical protein [Corynebacterium sp.]